MANLLRRINEISSSISDEDIFLSPDFKKIIQNFVNGVLAKIKMQPNIDLEYKTDGPVAYTDGNKIYLNAGNEISSSYKLRESRAIALLGIAFHECAHILYLDFTGEKKIADELNKKGVLHGKLETDDSDYKDYIAEIEDALKNERFRPVFVNLYHELSNIFSDVHDESKICNEYKGIVEKGIIFSAQAMKAQAISVEKLTKLHDEEKVLGFEIMLSLILEQARYGGVVIEDELKTQNNDFYNKVLDLAPVIQKGCTTDNLKSKYTAINSCILVLWPYIKEMLDKIKEQEKNQQNQPSSGQSDAGDSSSNGSGNGQNGSQGNSDDGNSVSGNSQGSNQSAQSNSGNQNSGNGNGTNDNGNSSGNKSSSVNNASDEAIKSVLNSISSASKQANPNAAPVPIKVPGNQKKKGSQGGGSVPAENSKNKKQNSTSQSLSDEEAQGMMQNILKQISNQMAKEKAEDEYEKAMNDAVNVIIQTVDMSSSHRGRNVTVHRDLEVSKTDARTYDSEMEDLKPVSKALQKQMKNVLRDMKEGDVLRHRSFGSKLEARDAYRIDSKFFSKKKLPQDLPDMAICYLVDLSGSMAPYRIIHARRSAMMMHDFAVGMNIPIMVCGHCTGNGGIHFHRYTEFEDVTGKDKYRLSHIRAYGAANRDGMAINIAADLLSKRPESVKLLIIASDGQPNDNGYGGEEAKKDIKEIVKKYKHKGVLTFAAAIGDDKDRIKSIYGDGYINIEDISTLPKSLTKLVKKHLLD